MMRSHTFAAFVASLVLLATAELVYYDESGAEATPSHAMLCSPGATKPLTFFYKGAKPTEVSITGPGGAALWAFKFVAPPEIKFGQGNHNITGTAEAMNDVGVQNYVVTVVDEDGKTASLDGKLICAGICIQDESGKCISGDDGAGVTIGASGSITYDVKAIDINGAKFDASSTKVIPAEKTGKYMEELDMSKTAFTADSFTLGLNNGRYGTGSLILTITNPDLVLDGEEYETVLIITQTVPENPLCYAVGGQYEIETSGQVRIPMYNLEKPPRKSPVKEVTLKIGTGSYEHVSRASKRDLPTQMMVFNPLTTGEADLVCDGVKAAVNGNGKKVVITGTIPEQPKDRSLLAKYYTKSRDRKAGFEILELVVVFKDSSPELLLHSTMQSTLAQIAKVTGGEGFYLEGVVSGSAICSIAGLCPDGQGETCKAALSTAFENCEIQNAIPYDCKQMVLQESKVLAGNAVGSGGALGVSAGLATWTIVLIAVVGAFAIILLIMLALWAVYRRNAEQSESDYSSSGPLGVPDPSDLLYEQSIVRDIYGRGDFPEGGPSAAAAAERAREADLREEFPRPPSTSGGVSRAAQTDDASSTYSV